MNALPLTYPCVLENRYAGRREYIHHSTQSLIASFDVARGQVICPLVGDTRTLVRLCGSHKAA